VREVVAVSEVPEVGEVMNRVEKAITYIPCPTCKAKPKRPCKTRTGNAYAGKWFVHWPRLRPFEEEYEHGVRYGKSLREVIGA
jgi:hypothetical protein